MPDEPEQIGVFTGGTMTIARFCNWADCGRTFAYHEIKAGRLVAIKMGRRTMIPVNGAVAWLQSHPSFGER